MYDTVVDDPKVQRLPLDAFRVWVNVLCLASQGGGKLPESSDMCFKLRMSEAEVEEWNGKLLNWKLLDMNEDGSLSPHNWSGRQYKTDCSTERVKKHREKRSMKRSNGTPDETYQKQRQSTDTETETDKPPCASGDAPKPSDEGNARAGAEDERRKAQQVAWFDKQHNQWHAAYWNRTAKKPSRKAYEKRVKALVSDYTKADTTTTRADLHVKASVFLATERDKYRRRFEGTDVWEARIKMHPATWLNDERWTDEDAPVAAAVAMPIRSMSREWDPSKDEEVG